MGRKRNLRALAEAQADEAPVRLRRTVDDRWTHGFVVSLGDDWVVLQAVDDLRLDGWLAIRVDTIGEVRRARTPIVIERALEFWGQRVEDPGIDASSTPALAASAGAAFDLVTIHEEERFPGECAVGRILKVTKKRLDLLDVSPGATWDDVPRRFPLQHITCLEVGDHYGAALAHLAGAPPTALREPVDH